MGAGAGILASVLQVAKRHWDRYRGLFLDGSSRTQRRRTYKRKGTRQEACSPMPIACIVWQGKSGGMELLLTQINVNDSETTRKPILPCPGQMAASVVKTVQSRAAGSHSCYNDTRCAICRQSRQGPMLWSLGRRVCAGCCSRRSTRASFLQCLEAS